MRLIPFIRNFRLGILGGDNVSCGDILDNKGRTIALFFSAIIFYSFYQAAMQPNWVLKGEMWAEMATNYYLNANASSYIQKLFSTDAGYIPVPQRLLGLIGDKLNLPAATIPYFYTWSSIFLTGALIGSFCLYQFRALVKSDALRFSTVLCVLMVADFETRTFINFTYFSAFFIAVLTALALADNSRDVPWWSWFIPVLMVSKPAVLAVLPVMIIVAVVSHSRFRWIVLISVVLCLVQFVQMAISSAAGTMPFRVNDITVAAKIWAAIKYFFGFLGGYTIGHSSHLASSYLILIGIGVFFFGGCLVYFKRTSSNAIVLVGLSLLFFNALLNTFALSDTWNLDMERLHGIPVYRHIIVGFFGCVLFICGVASSLTNNRSLLEKKYFDEVGGAIFLIWFIVTGWLSFAGSINKEPLSPTLGSSQWQVMADAIDAGASPICVPINPWWKGANWMYQRDCSLLKAPPAWEDGKVVVNDNLKLKLTPPSSLANKNLVSAALLIKPLVPDRSFISVLMRIDLRNGGVRFLSGAQSFNSSGGLLMLLGQNPIPINEISAITLDFNSPVEVASAIGDPADVPGIAWMGN